MEWITAGLLLTVLVGGWNWIKGNLAHEHRLRPETLEREFRLEGDAIAFTEMTCSAEPGFPPRPRS